MTQKELSNTVLKGFENYADVSIIIPYCCSVVQLFSHVQLSATPWTVAHQASLSFPTSWSLLKLMSIELVMPSNHLILCRPLLPTIFPSIRVFSNELALRITWPKYWSFSLSPSNEYSELISFRIDCFDFLAAQGIPNSLFSTIRKDQFFLGGLTTFLS